MNKHSYPILEFDPESPPVIEPCAHIQSIGAPERCVLCFFGDVIDRLAADHGAREIGALRSEMGRHPVYELNLDGRKLALLQPGITAPFAAALLEETICLGSRKFVACGSAGVLDPKIEFGRIVVPTAAVRDEGTSYHYLAPAREVEPSPEALAAVEHTLNEEGIDYLKGKTWTTDAFYRETRDKITVRRDEGCVTVEMEAAAFFAVARYRDVPFAQLLYAADDVSGMEWDRRDWASRKDVREKLFWLAAKACLRL